VSYAIIEDDNVIEVIGSPFADHTATDTSHFLRDLKLLPPVIPPMPYAARPNYLDYIDRRYGARRQGATLQYPIRPEPNFRSVHALTSMEKNIIGLKDYSGAVQPEGQLAGGSDG
jgi:hypothetical protein